MDTNRIVTKDEYAQHMDTVLRALTSFESGVSDYTNISYDAMIALAATVTTPGSVRFKRQGKARETTYFWLDQSLGAAGANAQSETAYPSSATANKPTRLSNTMQIMSKRIGITKTMERIARAGGLIGVQGDELGRQVQMQATLLLKDQEKAIFTGTESTSDPRAMKGLLNWVPAATTLDAAAVQITSSNVEAQVNAALAKVVAAEGGAFPNALYCGAGLLGPLGQAAKSKVQVTVNLSDLQGGGRGSKLVAGQAVGYFLSDFGMLELIYTPYLTAASASASAANSNALFLYEDAITIVEFIGANGVEIEELANTAPVREKVLSQEITLEVRYLNSHALLTNWYV